MARRGVATSVAIIVMAAAAWAGLAGAGHDHQGSSLNLPSDRSAVGFLDLHKRHPDGLEGPVEFEREYTLQQALRRLTEIEGFLGSFKQLTEQVRAKASALNLATVDNTGWALQNIGFHNVPLVVEGTLLKQEYRVKQLEYEVARLQRASGRITDADLARARSSYELATRRFQKFWDTRLPTD